MKKRPNGLLIGQKRVPLGVIGIIYEARPNVTADAFGLCFKTGNAVILKGGSDALDSNMAIVSCLRAALEREGADTGCDSADHGYFPRNDEGVYAAERVCGCTHSPRERRTDSDCQGEQYDSCDRDGNG